MQARLLLASLLLWTFGAQAQTQLQQESFESNGEGVRYNSTAFDLRSTLPAQYFTREDNPVQTPSGTYTFGLSPTGSTITNVSGTFFWASEGVKGQNTAPDRTAQTVTLNSTTITGYNNIQVKVKFADARGVGYFNPVLQWENNDYVRVKASVDGGPFVIIGQFVGDNPTASTAGNLRQDLDANLVSTGASSDNLSAPVLTQNMQDFTFNVSGTGSNIRVQIEVDQLGGTEELAFDDIRVFGTASATSPPALTNIEAGNLPYNEGDPATFVTSAITVGDPDNTTLTGGTVSISSGYVGGQDFLRFTNQNGITGNFNAGTLTLTGSATLAAYQAALRSIKYENTETVNAIGGNRTVTFTLSDGTNTSNAAIRTIGFVAQLNAPAALPYVEDFESNGEGTRYASNTWASASPCMGFLRTNSNPYICSPVTFTNVSGSWYWYAEGSKNPSNPNASDINNLEIAPVNATNFGNLIFNVRLGSGQSTQWDNIDYVKFYYKVNGGANVLFAAFYGNAVSGGELQRDTDLNGTADGVILNSNLQNFALALPPNITGGSVGFFIEVSNDGQEEVAMDRINITGTINNAPTIGGQTRSVAENSTNGTNVGAVVSASDADGNTLTYSITGGNTNGTFAINSGNGQITVANSGFLNFEVTPSYSLTVQVTDNGIPSANASATVTVNVTNVNEAPSISPQTFGIAENSANGSVVGAVAASDPDAGTTLSYSITNGNTGGAFTFVGNSLRVANSGALDFETTPTFSLTVQVLDGSLTASATVTVNLSDVAEGPTAVGLSPQSFPENLAVNTAVGNFSTTGPGSGYTYTLVSGAGSGGNSAFSIVSGQLRTAVAFDFETQNTYNIRVRSTDNSNSGLFIEQTFSVTVTNANEAPSISPQTFAIDENSANGTTVGTVSASDPDAGTTLTYTITNGNTGGAFTFVGNSLRVASSGALNFETTPTFSLTVQVSDGAVTDAATITVNLTNVNEAPSISPQTFAIDENSANGTVVGTVIASDPDGTTPTYSITNGNTGGAFTFVGSSLRVGSSAALDFETTPSFSLTVQVTDGSLTDVATITVNLNNLDDTAPLAPVVNAPANGSLINDQTPTYSGTAEANSTVTVIVDGSSVGTTTATGGGAWSLAQPVPLADGPHTVRATATDAANNTGPSSSTRNFTVDATSPTVTITSSATSPTTVTPIPFNITFSESVISFFPSDITVLNGNVIGFSGSGSSYSFSVVPTAPGNVQVNVGGNVAQDAATNGNFASLTFIIEYALPATSTTWLGGRTNNWFTASNWSDGVPTSTLDAIIPGGLPLPYPIISSGTGNARDLTIGSGGILSLNGGGLVLSRNLSNDGTFNTNTEMVQLNGNSQQTIGGSATTTFYDLLVGDSGANLAAEVQVRHVVQVNGNVASGGNLTLLSTATATAMAVNSGGVISGQSTVQRWVDGSLSAGSGYRHMSTPVSNTTFADLAATGFTPVVNAAYNSAPNPLSVTPYPNVFGFNEARFPASVDFTRGYFSPTALTDVMSRGRAYSVYFPGNRAVDFVGTLSTGNVTVTGLTRTGNFAAPGQKSGWQLLGNPYPSPIDWDLVTLPSGLSPSISVYRSTGGVNGTYTQYVNGVGPAGSDIVAVGQGFFALVTSGSPLSLTFTNACRVTDYVSPTFGRPGASASADTETRSIVGLRVKAANAPAKQVADETYVYFEAGATDGIDAPYDAVKFQHALGLPTLVSMVGTTEMGVNGLPEAALATTGTTVPLTLDAPRAGQYVIEAARMANLTGTAVALLDRLTNTRYDLTTTPSVQLSVAQPGVVSGRFELVIGRRLSTAPGVALTATLAPNPAHTQAKLLLNQPLATATTVTLHDAVGRVILTQSLAEGTSEATLDLRSLPVGVYVVRCGSLTSRLVVE